MEVIWYNPHSNWPLSALRGPGRSVERSGPHVKSEEAAPDKLAADLISLCQPVGGAPHQYQNAPKRSSKASKPSSIRVAFLLYEHYQTAVRSPFWDN